MSQCLWQSIYPKNDNECPLLKAATISFHSFLRSYCWILHWDVIRRNAGATVQLKQLGCLCLQYSAHQSHTVTLQWNSRRVKVNNYAEFVKRTQKWVEAGHVCPFVCPPVSAKKLLNWFRQNKHTALISRPTECTVRDHFKAETWGPSPAVFYIVLCKKKRTARFTNFAVSQNSRNNSAAKLVYPNQFPWTSVCHYVCGTGQVSSRGNTSDLYLLVHNAVWSVEILK
jgi:hypothetical protein